MNNFFNISMGLIVIAIMYNLSIINGRFVNVVSKIDNNEYIVRKLPDKQEAADRLATIAKNLKIVVDNMDTSIEGVSQLQSNFNSKNLTENVYGGKYTAFSVNKGEQLTLCLRDKDNKFIDYNIVYFVAIHELAHVMTDEIGHTPKFWNNMKKILEKAVSLDIYTKIDYSKNPTTYCGQEIKSSPLYS